jgi:hypothetical protein
MQFKLSKNISKTKFINYDTGFKKVTREFRIYSFSKLLFKKKKENKNA